MVFPKALASNTGARRRSGRRRATRASAQLVENRTLLFAAIAVAVLTVAVLILAVHHDDVRVFWQVLIRSVTGKVACNRTRHASNHRAGWIDDRIARTRVEIGLAAEWQRITVLLVALAVVVALNSTLHPHHTAAGNVGFQRRDSCCVVGEEVSDKVVVPVKDDH